MLKPFKILLFIFLILPISINSFADVDYYPKELIYSIDKLKNNFNEQELKKTYNNFVNFKGIKDTSIAFSLVDIAMNNKDKLNNRIIELITKFDIDNKDVIRDLLKGNYITKITLIPKYFTNFSIYVILKYISSIFLFLIFIYLFIKNKFIFFHIHKDKAKVLSLFYLLLFLLLPIISISFFIEYFFISISVLSIVLLLPEKNTSRIVLFIAILFAVIINNIDCDIKSDLNKNYLYSIINNPVSLSYLDNQIEKYPQNYDLKVIKAIKYPQNSENLFSVPKVKFSELGKLNLSIYYLMNKKFSKFKSLIKNNDLLSNPIFLLNLSSYFSITFQYKELEEINKRLIKYDYYYKLSEVYQHNSKSSLFLPYSGPKYEIFNEQLIYNSQFVVIEIILLFAVLLFIYYLSKTKEIFKCGSCGNIFCIHCDDGFEENQICATCRNIIFRKGNADASILVKKTILMDNYRHYLKVFSRMLSAVLPGAGQIFIDKPVKGILMTLLFSIVIFMFMFRFEPFITPNSYAMHLAFIPFYSIILFIFIIIYLINIFTRK